MKATLSFSTVLLLTILFISCNRSHTNKSADLLTAKIDSLLHTLPDFSGVILVASEGKEVYHKAFGFRDRDRQIELDTGDIFELASLSKQFTAMIIMMLEEQGKLKFDDSLSTYIEGLPYHGITIRHLLTHTSGLPDYQDVMDLHWDKSKIAGNAENIAYLIRYHPPQLFPAGEKYTYSNTGYMLLASVAEKVAGEDFITLCRKRIFNPVRMKKTDIRTRAEKSSMENFALGYIFVKEWERYVAADSFPEFNYTIWLGDRKGPGRISSTSHNMLLWDQALYHESLVYPATLQAAFSPMRLKDGSFSSYGFGWELSEDERVGKIVSHTGDNPGYKTEIVRLIDVRKTIILLNNNAHEKNSEIMALIKNWVMSTGDEDLSDK